MRRKLISLSGLLLLLIATTGFAKADTLYYFTNGSGVGESAPPSTLCGGTNCFGVVDLHQDGSNVDVTVTLTPNIFFIQTGNANSHETFAFDGTFSSSTITSPTGWTLGTSGTEAGIGTFNFYQDCNIDNCTTPGNSTLSSLAFTVDGTTISAFGTSFAADVSDQLVGGKPTGNIETGAGINVPSVPEPSSLLLFGTGLAALAGTLKLKLFSGV